MNLLFLAVIFWAGCVPWDMYQNQKKALSRITAERDATQIKLDNCEDENKKLKKDIRSVPVKRIEPAELDAIKKKALGEAEEKYKLRIRRIQKLQ